MLFGKSVIIYLKKKKKIKQAIVDMNIGGGGVSEIWECHMGLKNLSDWLQFDEGKLCWNISNFQYPAEGIWGNIKWHKGKKQKNTLPATDW
jgi:hypothetical protein